jgi:serine protease Do
MFDPLRAKARVIGYTGVAFLFGLGLASGLGWTGPSFAMPTVTEVPQVQEEAVRPALDLSDAFANVAEQVTPAVVRIEVTSTRQIPSSQMRIPEGFRDFFNLPDDPDMENHPGIPSLSGGSGFFISEDGYILTNNHVVGDADEIRVFLVDGRQYVADLVGADPTTDVAVIKIDDTGLSHLSLGRSGTIRVGEWILAVGNPGFGSGNPDQLDYTVTAGIISAKGRPLQLIQSELQRNPEAGIDAGFAIEDFIQTDAVINRGNSGGPMVNLMGQVIGINSAILTPTGTYAGYGFAIPIDLASRVMEDLIEYGRVRRAWLGVRIREVAQEDQEYYNLPEVAGVLVSEATEGGPAEAARLQPEDIIYSVDGTVVYTPSGLQNLIAQRRPGETVMLRVYRERSPLDVRVRLGEAPLTTQEEPEAEGPAPAEEEALGIGVSELTPDLAGRWGYDSPGGVIITQVTPRGPADRRQVFRGEKLLAINDQPVESVEDVEAILRRVEPGQVVGLRLAVPDGTERTVTVRTRR